MQVEEIISQIQQNLEGDPAELAQKAKDAYTAAMNHIAMLDSTPWNKISTTFDIVVTDSDYELGSDILTDYPQVLGMSEIWRTDIQDAPVPLIGLPRFNHYARGSTETGEPLCACLHGKNRLLEFYPIPDKTYTLWCEIRVPLELTDIPEAFHPLIVWDAAMLYSRASSGAFQKAMSLRQEMIGMISESNLTKIKPDQIKPDYILGRSDSRGSNEVNTYDHFGM